MPGCSARRLPDQHRPGPTAASPPPGRAAHRRGVEDGVDPGQPDRAATGRPNRRSDRPPPGSATRSPKALRDGRAGRDDRGGNARRRTTGRSPAVRTGRRAGRLERPDRGAPERDQVAADPQRRHRDRGPAPGCRCRWSSRRTTSTSRNGRPPGRAATEGRADPSKRLTITGRARARPCSPYRTRRTRVRPSTLIADTDDGTCRIAPVSGPRAGVELIGGHAEASAPPVTVALGVVGVRVGPEPDGGRVGLGGQRQSAQQSGGPVDARAPTARSPSGRASRRGRPCGCAARLWFARRRRARWDRHGLSTRSRPATGRQRRRPVVGSRGGDGRSPHHHARAVSPLDPRSMRRRAARGPADPGDG